MPAPRRMTADDIPAAHSILVQSPEAAAWSRESLSETMKNGLGWILEVDGAIAGILIGRVAADEFEILNLAVEKAHRRHGVATKLVRAAVEQARTAGARKAYLEVRASNEGGIAFYARLGFCKEGRRAQYYRDPAEDAVLLVLHNFGTSA
jgi:ribosomal-protein-alanine N-acetyltransferase